MPRLGFQFFTFHRTLALQFEESLLSILSFMNSTVKAAPYWDYSIDTNDAENSVIFSDDYFGSLSGDENNGYTLSDAKFAFWKVHNINDMDNQTELDWALTNCPKHNDEEGIIYAHRNPYGYLRYV